MICPVFGTRYTLHLRVGLLQAETLKTLWVTQYLAPLLGQGGALCCALLLPRDADLKDLLSFLPRGRTAEGWQAERDAGRILRVAHPVVLGHPEKRFDSIGTDRQADVIETEWLRRLQLEVKIGAELQAQSGGGHRIDQRLALAPGVVREPLRFEHLLALKQAEGIGTQPLDEGFARGQ